MKQTSTTSRPGTVSGFLRTLLSALLCMVALWLLVAPFSASLFDSVWPVTLSATEHPGEPAGFVRAVAKHS